jgi:hypothetical protein
VSKRGNTQIDSSALNLLGLRVGLSADAFGQISFFEAGAKADALGTGFLEASSSLKVSPEIPKNLDYNPSPDKITAVKNRLAELNLRLVAYCVDAIPADESSRRRLFAFAKSVDIETIVTSTAPVALSELDKLANEFGVNFDCAASRGRYGNVRFSAAQAILPCNLTQERYNSAGLNYRRETLFENAL